MSPDSPPTVGMLARISTALKHFVHPNWDRNQVLASIEETAPLASSTLQTSEIVHDTNPNVLGVQKIVELLGKAPEPEKDLTPEEIRAYVSAQRQEAERDPYANDKNGPPQWTHNSGMPPDNEWTSGYYPNKDEPWH